MFSDEIRQYELKIGKSNDWILGTQQENPFNFKVGTGEQLEKNPRSYGGKPRFYAYYGIEEMRSLIAQANLKVIEAEPYPKTTIFGERIVQIWALKP